MSAPPHRPTTFELLAILGLGLLVHAWPLAMPGLYWDDWWVVGGDAASLVQVFRDAGAAITGHLHVALAGLTAPGFPPSPLPWRVMNLVATLAGALLLRRLLEDLPDLGRDERLLATLLFLTFPVFPSRFLLILTPNALWTLAHLGATFLYARAVERGSVALRALALGLFALAFTNPGNLTLHGVAILYLLRLDHHAGRVEGWPRHLVRRADLFLVPVACYLVARFLNPPQGVFVGYNRLKTLDLALGSPLLWLAVLKLNLIDPVVRGLLDLGPAGVATSVLAAGALAAAQARVLPEDPAPSPEPRRRALALAAMGLVAFVLAVFPYMAVGKIPSAGWRDGVGLKIMDRTQAGLPLAGALLGVGLVAGLGLGRRTRLALLWLGVAAGPGLFLRTYAAYQRDHVKQVALREHFATQPEVAAHHTFLVEDPGREGWVFGRFPRFFELTALFRAATGEQTRFACYTIRRRMRASLQEHFSTARFHLGEYSPGPPERLIRLAPGPAPERSALAWWRLEREDPAAFAREAAATVTMTFHPPPPEEDP